MTTQIFNILIQFTEGLHVILMGLEEIRNLTQHIQPIKRLLVVSLPQHFYVNHAKV
jgi:hypothetical protein